MDQRRLDRRRARTANYVVSKIRGLKNSLRQVINCRVTVMKRYSTIALCLFLLVAGASSVLAKCRPSRGHGGHDHHGNSVSHDDGHSADHVSSENDHQQSVIHCADLHLQLGSMLRQSTMTISGPRDGFTVVPVALPKVYVNGFKALADYLFSRGKFGNGISHYLFFSVLQI